MLIVAISNKGLLYNVCARYTIWEDDGKVESLQIACDGIVDYMPLREMTKQGQTLDVVGHDVDVAGSTFHHVDFTYAGNEEIEYPGLGAFSLLKFEHADS